MNHIELLDISPQIPAYKEYGPEPTLRQLVRYYYAGYVPSENLGERCKQYEEAYVEALLEAMK